jgi:hypothetical protein
LPEAGLSPQPSLQAVDDSNPRSSNWATEPTANSGTWPTYGFDSGSAALQEETASMATAYSWCYSQGQQSDMPFPGYGYSEVDMVGLYGCDSSHMGASSQAMCDTGLGLMGQQGAMGNWQGGHSTGVW